MKFNNFLILLIIHVTHSSRTEYLAIKQSDIGSFKKYSQLKSSVVEDGTDQIVEVFDSLVGNFTSEVSRNSEINYEIKLPNLEGYSITLETKLIMEDNYVSTDTSSNNNHTFDSVTKPVEFLVHLTPSVSYWTLSPRIGEEFIERTLCPPNDDKLRLTVSTSNISPLRFYIAIRLYEYELKLNEPVDQIILHSKTRSFFYYKFQDDVEHINIRVKSEGYPTCGLLYVQPHNQCLDQEIPESSLDIQEDEGTKHLTFLEKGLIPYSRSRQTSGILVVVYSYHSQESCYSTLDFQDSDNPNNTMLTLVVEKRVEDLLSSVLAVSITAVMTVLIALTVSFFIYRENLQKKFKDLVLELKKRSEESKNLSSDAEDDLTETDDSVEIVRNPSVSDYYTTMIMLMGVFYTLPTLQLVFNYQHTFNIKGDLDLCYYNFECLYTTIGLQDFGHVFSNIGYIIFGIAFNIIVYIRHNFDNKTTNNRYNDGDRVQRGVPLDTGIYYALGATSIGEGFLSACYHVCPTVVNFQFDTTFMYTMSLLMLLKLYQFRHPKATPTSFQTFGLLSMILVIEVAGYFFIALWFYIVFVLTHALLMAYAVYHILKNIKKVKLDISVLCCHKCETNCQCLTLRLTLLAVLVNLGLDVYILMERTPGCSSYILLIIMTNMAMYNFYYVTRKLYCYHFKGLKNEQIGVDSYAYIAGAAVCVVFSGKYYTDIEKSTLVSPAESRILNSGCKLGIFDNHDIWHFFSSMGIFLTFMFLLTLEDKNKTTRTEQIQTWNKINPKKVNSIKKAETIV